MHTDETLTDCPNLHLSAETVGDIEIVGFEVISDTEEAFTVQIAGRRFRVVTDDALVLTENLRSFAAVLGMATTDARQDRADADAVLCWCGTKLDPDEANCGATRCVGMDRHEVVGA